MPIIRYKDKVMHFAHIPKCAGTSIEKYFHSLNGVEMAFFDSNYHRKSTQQPWNRSSPQHIDGKSLSRIFPSSFFDVYFAIVRNPVDRVKSAFRYQQQKERKINSTINIDTFIQQELLKNYLTLGWFDNHFLPQTKFFYPNVNYKIFKLEQNGPNKAKRFIDQFLFKEVLDTNIGASNISKKQNEQILSDKSKEIIYELYAKDFKSFGYPTN